MFDDKEAVEGLKRQCRNGKEVEGGYHFAMVVQKCHPALGVALVSAALEVFEIAGDGRFGDLEAELEQLAVDARRTPGGIFILHLPNEKGNLRTDLGPVRWPGFQRQNRRTPARCQDVSGLTRMRASA